MFFLLQKMDPNNPVWVTVVLFESNCPVCSVNLCVAGAFLPFILVWCWAYLVHPIRGFLLWQQKYRAIHKRPKILHYLVWRIFCQCTPMRGAALFPGKAVGGGQQAQGWREPQSHHIIWWAGARCCAACSQSQAASSADWKDHDSSAGHSRS